MIDFFREDKPENNDTLMRENEKSRTSLYAAADYELSFANRLLNNERLSETDRFNIARTLEWFNYELRKLNAYSCGFEQFMCKTLGEDVFSKLVEGYITSELMREFEERLNAN